MEMTKIKRRVMPEFDKNNMIKVAKKIMTWNINYNENYYKIEADTKQVTINNGEPFKLRTLPRNRLRKMPWAPSMIS